MIEFSDDVLLAMTPWVRRTRFVAFDFDGVFTDNAVYVDQDGRETVRCSRWEGFGLQALRDRGVLLAVISTEANPVVGARCAKLRLDCHQGVEDKPTVLRARCAEAGIALAETAFVGNDANDRGCLEIVGFPIVVADAHPSVASLGRYRTKTPGGHGAVREICDLFVAVWNR
ncbi:MAG: HAD hydrolase family protein [Fimbriimonadaceae bacterium]|nr:HAD hydrolase family protein [Fimbriimonadaceae bacterium]